MRLIDADTLVKDLSYLYTKNHIPVDMRAKEILTTIMEQPTAYSVDKVVEYLEKESYTTTDTVCGGIFEAIRLSSAIEIVKQGGVDDDVCECRRLKGYNFLFKTSCGNVFDMENGFKFCPYCGKKIKVVE